MDIPSLGMIKLLPLHPPPRFGVKRVGVRGGNNVSPFMQFRTKAPDGPGLQWCDCGSFPPFCANEV
jgi:hypothetical protein